MVSKFEKVLIQRTLLAICSNINAIISKCIANLCETFSIKCYKRKNTYLFKYFWLF